jgi:hypothetical protein
MWDVSWYVGVFVRWWTGGSLERGKDMGPAVAEAMAGAATPSLR